MLMTHEYELGERGALTQRNATQRNQCTNSVCRRACCAAALWTLEEWLAESGGARGASERVAACVLELENDRTRRAHKR